MIQRHYSKTEVRNSELLFSLSMWTRTVAAFICCTQREPNCMNVLRVTNQSANGNTSNVASCNFQSSSYNIGRRKTSQKHRFVELASSDAMAKFMAKFYG